jgi:putative glutamine amidotransferase
MVERELVIGITDCEKYANYERWIGNEPNVRVVKLGYVQENFEEIKGCDGLLLTGGEDVDPRFYDKPEWTKYCHSDDMDERRDEFELRLLAYSQKNSQPILGICRGLQIANVFFGGSLIPDMGSFDKPDHTKIAGKDRYHDIQLKPDSLLKKIVGSDSGAVNSAHHQCVDRIGAGLRINASTNGVVEGLEGENADEKSFLLLVQWHPERMMDLRSPLSRNVLDSFLNRAKIFAGKRRVINL